MARSSMPPIRSLAVALTLASLASACGSEGLECPATGAPLLSGVPELQPEWGPGCIDSASWTADIDPADAIWTVELRRERNGSSPHVARLLDGVAVVWGTELILVDGEGNELTSRDIGSNVDWSSFAVTDAGQMIVADQSGNAPLYRVLAPTGVEVWLRLLDVDAPLFAAPALSLAADGSLWVGVARFTPDFQDFELVMQQWAVTGAMQSEVVLPGLSSQAFARDGAGRFLVIDAALELFAADGTKVASVDVDSDVNQIVGLDDGFVIGGAVDDLPALTRIDGQGEIVWQRSLPSSYADDYYYSYVSGVAPLPEGGVVAVGTERTIATQWPDSPITESGQPFVVALTDEGVPTWGERLAVGGRAWSVAIGSQGEVYVAGTAQASKPSEYGDSDEIVWLRRYEP